MNRSFGEVLAGRGNALTLIRVVLAAVVVLGHSFTLSGLGPHPEVGGVGIGSWAVLGFFVISGYVVTQSRSRLRISDFLVNRALRILPGFWVVLLLTALVAAPLAALVASSSLDPRSAVSYVVRNAGLVINQWGIDGTLQTAPLPSVWNGSLWTLVHEAAWYGVVALLFLLVGLRRHLPAVSLLGLVLLSALSAVGVSWSILGAFFLAGVFFFSVRDRVRVVPVLLVGAAAVLVLAVALRQVVLLAPLPLGYLVLAAAALPSPPVVQRGDISYGLYIYAFPVQQLLAVSGVARLGVAAFAVLSLVTTAPLAWLSWRLVEAPALRLRRRGHQPGGDPADTGREDRSLPGDGSLLDVVPTPTALAGEQTLPPTTGAPVRVVRSSVPR